MDVSIDEWVACFVRTQDRDDVIAAEARRWVDEQIKVSPEVLLNVACTIMQDMEYPIVARRMASIAASSVLNPRDRRHLAEICEVWQRRSDLADQVKECLYTTILSEDEVIRSQAALTFALVFGIEGDGFAAALDQIYEIIAQSTDSPLQTIGLLSIFKGILSLTNFAELKKPILMDSYVRLWTFALDFVASTGDIPLPVRYAAAECVRDAIEVLPEICFDKHHKPVLKQIQAVLATLPASMQQPDKLLFQCCHQIMFNLIQSYYEIAPEFLEPILEYTTLGIQTVLPEQAECRQLAIYLWKEVAAFERGIAKKAQRFPEQTYHKIVVTAGEHLLPNFFGIMCEVSPDDTNVEDITEQSPSMFATMAIAEFYDAAPEEIFVGFIEPTFNENIGNEAWPIHHAALLLLYCISNRRGYPKAYALVMSALPRLFDSCRRTDIPRVRETALFVLAVVLKAFKGLFSGHLDTMFSVTPPDFVQGILDLLRLDENPHPLILSRYTQILYYLGCIWEDAVIRFRSPLAQFFEPIVELLKQIMDRPIDNEEDMQLYQSASQALNAVILNGTYKLHQMYALKSLFRQTLQELETAKTMIETPAVRFDVQASLCSNLASLALRLGSLENGIAEDELHEAIGLLFQVLSQEHALTYEEAVFTLASLYLKLHDKFTTDELERMMKIIAASLISELPGVITSASVLLGNLFHFAGSQLVHYFDDFFTTEAMLLRTHKDMKSIHPSVVRAIAEMFQGVFKDGSNWEVVSGYEDELFELLKMVRQAPINPMNPSDLQYANDLFGPLAQLYTVFAVLFYPRAGQEATAEERQRLFLREREYLIEMVAFARVLEMMDRYAAKTGGDWAIDEYVIEQFSEMAEQYGQHCTTQNNVILNRASVHRVLEIGKRTEQTFRLRKKCKEVASFLKSR